MCEIEVKRPINSRILEAGPGAKLTVILVAVLILAAIVGAFTTTIPFKIGIGVLVGIIVSATQDTPTGATIVLVAGLIFMVTFIWKKRQK